MANFWGDNEEPIELISEDIITTKKTYNEYLHELEMINKQLSLMTHQQIYLLKRYSEVSMLLNKGDRSTSNSNDHSFISDLNEKSKVLRITYHGLLPKVKKTMSIKNYIELRQYYVPKIIDSIKELNTNIKWDRVLVCLETISKQTNKVDPDNRFTTFILDALVQSKVISDDGNNNISLMEITGVTDSKERTNIYVIPFERAGDFTNNYVQSMLQKKRLKP